MNFDCGHIVNIVDLFRIVETLVEKKSCLSLKATLESFFLFHIMKFGEIWGFDIRFMKILK